MSVTRRPLRLLLAPALAGALLVAACSGGNGELDFEPAPPSTTVDAGSATTTAATTGATTAATTDDRSIVESTRVSARPVDGELVVEAASARALDRRLFGTNVPAWLGPELLADPDFQAATVALGTTLLRFPGGSWSNHYDWLACEQGDEAAGCFWTWAARPSDYAAFMRATGLPGMWTASFNGSAEEAAAVVAFFNGSVDDTRAIGVDEQGQDWLTVGDWARLRADGGVPDPTPIDLWEVGNEIYGATADAGPECAEFGWEEVWTCDGTAYALGDETHDGYLEFHAAMDAVDPGIAIGAVGVADGDSWGAWGTEVVAGAGDVLDFYVVHHYGFGSDVDAGTALEIPQRDWPDLVAQVTAVLASANTSHDVPIAITEYNLVAFQDADTEQLMARAVNLLYIADTIGQMAEQGIAIANQWNLANGDAPNGTDYGLIDVETGVRNPQYYALALWTRVGDELLDIDVGFDEDNELSAYAGRADDGTVSVLAVNKTSEPIAAHLRIADGAAAYTARADVVAASSLDATTVTYNGSDAPSADLSDPPATDLGEVGSELDHTFAPYSVTLLRLTPQA